MTTLHDHDGAATHSGASLADLLQPAFEGLPVAVLLVAPDGAIAMANREAERLFGYAAPELIGLSVDALVADAARGRHADLRHAFLEQPSASRMAPGREVLGRRKDGSELPLDVSLATIRVHDTVFVIASAIDITERHQLPREMRRASGSSGALATVQPIHVAGIEHFGNFANLVPAPIFACDENGLLLFGNDRWLDITAGHSTIGAPWTNACHPADRRVAAAAAHVAVADRRDFTLEVRLANANGAYRWWEVCGAPHFGPDGRLRGYVATCSDVTPARHTQQALHDAGARLIASQEAIRSRIARELHDDLGQQVVILATRLDILMAQGPSGVKPLRAAIAETQQGLQELARGVHLLSHELHPAKLRLLGLERTIAGLRHDIAAGSGIDVKYTTDGVIGELPDDRSLCLFRIAQEALQNAVKHSGATVVTISLSGTPAHISLRVTDDGAGFDSLSLSTGLGLLTMRERVELIGGTLRIHTAPGSGTTIEVTVPVAPEASTDDSLT